jgi:hypothetical protein
LVCSTWAPAAATFSTSPGVPKAMRVMPWTQAGGRASWAGAGAAADRRVSPESAAVVPASKIKKGSARRLMVPSWSG